MHAPKSPRCPNLAIGVTNTDISVPRACRKWCQRDHGGPKAAQLSERSPFGFKRGLQFQDSTNLEKNNKISEGLGKACDCALLAIRGREGGSKDEQSLNQPEQPFDFMKD